jgi:shikimate 5-dehydrogenase
VKILLVNLGDAADLVDAMLMACFNFEGLSAEVWQLDNVSMQDVNEVLKAGDIDGLCVDGPLRRELMAACGELEGDARAMGWIDSARPGGNRLIGDNTGVLALELGMSHAKMWPKVASKVLVLGSGDRADTVAHALAHVPQLQIVVATDGASGRIKGNIGWRDEAFRATLADADLIVNTTDLALGDLPFTIRELPQRCGFACTGIGERADEIVAHIGSAHRHAMTGTEILLASTMLCFSRWTGIQPAPSSVARGVLR